jgi:hypothetical protein
MPAWLVLLVIAGTAFASFGYWVQTGRLAKKGREIRRQRDQLW